MARKAKRVAVERGLYRAGDVWWACATPKGERTARWLRLGDLGIQEARRRRDEFAYKLNARQLPLRSRRLTVREVQADWFAHLDELELAGELRPRTVASYKDGVACTSRPRSAAASSPRSRQTTSLTGTRSNAGPAPRLGRFGPAGWESEGCSHTPTGQG